MVRMRSFTEGPPFDQAHGVERLLIVRPERQFVDRHDPWMFQLSCDSRLLKKPCPVRDLCGAFRAEFFQGDVGTKLLAVRPPGAAAAPAGLKSRQAVPLRRPRTKSTVSTSVKPARSGSSASDR